MSNQFNPIFSITPQILQDLLRIEATKEQIKGLPLTPTVLASLRETSRLVTTHYSTMIEGNQLEIEQIKQVLTQDKQFAGYERDEREVKGYYAALTYLEQLTKKQTIVTEKIIQQTHALVMGSGSTKVQPTPYRDAQNSIRESATKRIVYLPPEAKDVPILMRELVDWINTSDLPAPIIAAIAHYQFATIHPYMDGNGRTARLLTTFILHLKGYDLKGIYSLDEYYAQKLGDYYEVINVGDHHNYYFGRAEADITGWISYFCAGMAHSFAKVLKQMQAAQTRGEIDQSDTLRYLEPAQREIIKLFQKQAVLTRLEIGTALHLKPRSSAALCRKWLQEGFLEIEDPSNKARSYRLSLKFESLLHSFD